MEFHGFIILILLACTLLLSPIYATPNHGHEQETFPHFLEIDASDIFLFNLVKDIKGSRTAKNVKNVLTRILTIHQISFDRVSLSLIRPLKSKLERLWKSYKQQKGSRGRQNLLDSFEESNYTLKVHHTTGSPTKRKLKETVDLANAKVRKLEDNFDNVISEFNQCKNHLAEAQRKVDRLSNPMKNRKERGKAKNKQIYSRRQRRRLTCQKVDAIKELLGESDNKYLSVEFSDENGQIVKVAFNENNATPECTQIP